MSSSGSPDVVSRVMIVAPPLHISSSLLQMNAHVDVHHLVFFYLSAAADPVMR
jgi:hypothetical protein